MKITKIVALILCAILMSGCLVSCNDSTERFVFHLQFDGTYSVSAGGAPLVDDIDIPSTYKGKPVTKIEQGGFASCTDITSITIPDGIIRIGRGAFENCSNLEEIAIPEGVTNIDNDTFSGCTNLKAIKIPNSVTRIGSQAFYGCSNLGYIRYMGTKNQWDAISKGEKWYYTMTKYNVECEDGTIHASIRYE